MVVAHGVDDVEIEGGQGRALGGGQVQPGQHLIHAGVARHRLIEGRPVAGPHAADVGLGPRPEHGGGLHALPLGRDPDRLALIPPAAIGDGLLVAEREAAQFGVDHVVADDAVVIGMQPRDQGVVVGEGHAGEGRLHRPRRPVGRQLRQHRRRPTFQVIRAEAVDGDQDDVRRLGRLDQGRRGGAGGDDQRQDGGAGQAEQAMKHGDSRKRLSETLPKLNPRQTEDDLPVIHRRVRLRS
ncbi:hypothetical protein D3C73_828380 [compost metagenome]